MARITKRQGRRFSLGLAALLSLGFLTPARPQSSDALINKLVEKGILTVKEAEQLREEAKDDFKKAYRQSSGLPEWVTSVGFGGDLRGRYEGFFSRNPTAEDRNRFQYRLRVGAKVVMLDDFEVGVRVASIGDTAGNPISSNQTFDNNASKKGLAIDLAYGRWTPIDNERWAVELTLGKMENPWVLTPAVIDPDYTPEGLGQRLTWHVNHNHDLKLNLGEFVLEEQRLAAADAYLFGAQARWDAKWSPAWQTSLGFGTLAITGRESLTVANGQLNIGEGNTRIGNDAANAPLYDFQPLIVDGSVTWVTKSAPLYRGSFPVRLAAEYLNNPRAPDDNEACSVKLTLGRSGKRGTWEASYEFREVQADSFYEELPESDFNAFTQTAFTTGGVSGFVNGTNIRGHIFRLGYSPYDAMTVFVTYWLTENINENPTGSISRASRLQVDALWRF